MLGQALPWTPLALLGAGLSLGRLLGDRGTSAMRGRPRLLLDPLGGDRLLLAWAVAPLVLVSLSSARNAHYAIHAMIPWSVWSALGLANLGGRLAVRGWSRARLRRLAVAGFAGLAAACGLGHWLAGPWLDRRGMEWAFYETTGHLLASGEPLALLYDDWDREAYPTPFGAIPHDLAVRLYYLKRPACWHFDAASLRSPGVGTCLHRMPQADEASLVILGRERDLPALEAMGRVEVIARSRGVRWDRTYLLARVWLGPEPPRTALRIRALSTGPRGDPRGRPDPPLGRDARGRRSAVVLAPGRRVPVRSLDMEPLTYDLVVIGSGPAGESGAATAASFGKRVADDREEPAGRGRLGQHGDPAEQDPARDGAGDLGPEGAGPLRRRPVAPPRGDRGRLHVPRAAGHGQRAAAGRAGAGPARGHALPRHRLVRRSRTPCGSSRKPARPGPTPRPAGSRRGDRSGATRS